MKQSAYIDEVNMTQDKISKSKRLWLALILGVLSAFGPFSLDMYLPALPILADDLQTSASYAQLSLTACMFGLALGQLFAGPLSDVKGRRFPLIGGLVLFSIASILCIVAPSIETFIALRFIQGAAGAAGIVISRAIVRDLYSGIELTKFFALLMLVNGAGPIIAPVIGGQLLQFTSWRGVFFVLSLIGIVSLIGVLFGLGETLTKENRANGGLKQILKIYLHIMKDKVFMGYVFAQSLVGAAMFAYISGSPFVLQKVYDLSPQMFSLCFAINGAGIIVASQLTGRLVGHISEAKLLLTGLTSAALGGISLLVAVLVDAPLLGILIPLFIVVSSVGVVNTTTFGLAMKNQAKTAGSASALFGLVTFLLGGTLAPLVGIAGENTAVPMGIVIAIADVGALFIYLLVIRKGRKTK